MPEQPQASYPPDYVVPAHSAWRYEETQNGVTVSRTGLPQPQETAPTQEREDS